LGVQENHVRSIRDESKIYSASADGKIPWVSADDIAAVAVQMLTMQKPANTEFCILGPELLAYEDVSFLCLLRRSNI
jgi:festuclavine dehydrogenase